MVYFFIFILYLYFTIQDAKRRLHRRGSNDSIDSFVDYGSQIADLLDSNMVPGKDLYLRCLKCGKDFKYPAFITSSELITCSCGSESICVIETA
jgi:DNA-directed RNA polymerase subunit RPC12/RpoP